VKRWLSITLQILASAGQLINLVEPYLTLETKAGVVVGLGVAQVLVNAIAHGSNPDGTPAEVAWTPAPPRETL
jgi:hypothetical protein